MLRTLVLALGVAVLPVAVGAAPSPSPAPAAASARDGGTIDGRVTSIDYRRSVLGVDAGPRGQIDVTVMPSTSIQAKDAAYHSFTDLKTGQRVQIFTSITSGTIVAQIIRIR